MISVLYIILAALIIGQLAMQVIKLRRKYKVRMGDGDNPALQFAIAAQTNATEYLPIGMLLLLALELNAAPVLSIHALGITFISGRIIHAKAMLADKLPLRVRSMQITFYTLLVMGMLNLVYLPYAKLIKF